MCESIAIVDHGRVVVGGPLARDPARGRPAARPPLGRGRPPAAVARRRAGGADPAAGHRPDRDRARRRRRARGGPRGGDRGRRAGDAISRSTRSSLEQIFIDHVGRPADDDEHLAPDDVRPAGRRRGRGGRPTRRRPRSRATSRRPDDGRAPEPQRAAHAERRLRRPPRVRRARPAPAVLRLDARPRRPRDVRRGPAGRGEARRTRQHDDRSPSSSTDAGARRPDRGDAARRSSSRSAASGFDLVRVADEQDAIAAASTTASSTPRSSPSAQPDGQLGVQLPPRRDDGPAADRDAVARGVRRRGPRLRARATRRRASSSPTIAGLPVRRRRRRRPSRSTRRRSPAG